MDGKSWFEFLSDSLEESLTIAIEAGAYAGLLAIVVLLIDVLFRRWLSAGQMGLLWGLVLVRLLVPTAPVSRVSLEQLLTPQGTEATSEQLAAASTVPTPNTASNVPDNIRKLADLNLPNIAAPVSVTTTDWIDEFFSRLPFVWFIGGVLGLAWTLGGYAWFCRRVNRVPECEDERLLRLWKECREMAGVRRIGRIRQFDGIDQPAVMGVLRPTLLLPSDVTALADDRLRLIMLHELAHVRRWDIATNWALVAIRAIHWWNPVYWLAASRFYSLREQACDAFVVRHTQKISSNRYGDLLLALAERRPRASSWQVMLPASIVSFFPAAFRKHSLRVRLRALRNAGVERGHWHAAGIAGVILLLALSGFTAATPEETPPMDLPTWMASNPEVVLQQKRSYLAQSNYEGPRESRNYDIAKCLERIAVDSGSRAQAQRDLEITLNGIYNHPVPIARDHAPTAGNATRAEDKEKLVPLTFQIYDTTLTAAAPAALHANLQRTLNAWTESGQANQVVISTRFLASNRDLIAGLGVSWQFMEALSSDNEGPLPEPRVDGNPVVRAAATVDQYLPLVVASLDERQTEKLIEIAQGDRRTNVLNAPKITIFNGQEATIVDCSQRPFVIGVIPIIGELATADQPKIIVIEEGTRIVARGTVSRDLKKIHLEASLSVKSLGTVTNATTIFHGQPVSIQVPSVNRQSIETVADLADGHTLLVGCIPTEQTTDSTKRPISLKQRFAYYLLTVHRLGDRSATSSLDIK